MDKTIDKEEKILYNIIVKDRKGSIYMETGEVVIWVELKN